MFDFLKRILMGSSDREVKKILPLADQVMALEEHYKAMSDEALRGETLAFKERLKNGQTLNDIMVDALAVGREGAFRAIGQYPFRTQVIGAIALHQGRIAEMRTGEGKTLTAALAAYLNGIAGDGVHIVTVNDYLARFHSEWMGKLYRFLGLTVGLIVHDLSAEERQEAYGADMTYGTNNELGFDYLRDNMVAYKERMVQRKLHFAIVDEVDSILIDEARTPLIISGQGEKSTELYTRANQFAQRLREPTDFERDEKKKTLNLTEPGVKKAEQAFGVDNLTDAENTELYHHILQALRANAMMKRDVDYVVQNGEVVIVDEFTGRLMVGRRYSEGLHQAIEAKEKVKVERESRTLATITFQNYFRMYKKLSGMTGTAKTEEEEFQGIYKLDVVTIPTHRPMIRQDLNDAIFTSEKIKFNAVVEEIIKRHATGQPVLVGTVSVEKSELVSDMLERRGVKHVVLNAKFHEKEAEIVAQAGHLGAVTIATNMAGRGTDILLGGNAEFMARHKMRQMGYDDELIEEAIGFAENVPDEVKEARGIFKDLLKEFKVETDRGHDEVVAMGGLHIIGTERHESRRIDNQLRGRAGRQGDPGSSQFFISLEDELMRLFGSDRIKPIVDRLGLEDGQAIEYGVLSKQIENAQKRVEGRNFEIRKNVLEYDDVMNQQRELIYGQRRDVLEGGDMRSRIMDMRNTTVEEAVTRSIANEEEIDTWDIKSLADYIERICVRPGDTQRAFEGIENYSRQELVGAIEAKSDAYYADREKMIADEGVDMREVERVALLTSVDRRWMDHIDAMDQLRDGIGLRAYGQRNPIVEYKFESYDMFDEMIRLIQEDTLKRLYMAVLRRAPERRVEVVPTSATHSESAAPQARKPASAGERVGRNDPCPCGSGKKYKVCCGRN